MSYRASISEDEKYILVRVEDEITVELATQFTEEAHRMSLEHGIKRFLFDVRGASNVEKTFRNYFYVHEDMAGLELDRAARSAILASAEDTSHDFVELVCANAGYNVKLFKEEAAAVAWLEE